MWEISWFGWISLLWLLNWDVRNSLLFPAFLGEKNNLWKIDGQIDGLIIVIPPCCEIHARYSVITEKICGNLWAFSWLWMNLFVLVLELRCFSSLFFLDWGKHGSINGGRTFQKIWKNHAHIPSLVSYFSSMVPSFPEQGGEHPNSKTITNESIQNHENSWHV